MTVHRRRIGLGVLLIGTALLLTGCWDRKEINDIAFVLTSSADLEEDGKIRVAYMLPLPGQMGGASGGGGGTGGGKSYYIDSEVGNTLREATQKLQLRMARKIILSHRRTVIVGEDLAKKGIGLMFDEIPRTPESRLTSFLVVAKGKGYDLLNTEPKFERFPAEAIRELAKSPQVILSTTKDIGLALGFHSDPIVTYMEAAKTQAGKKPTSEVEIAGYAQFLDDRMVGIYKNEEAFGLMWLKNKIREHLLTFPVTDHKDISILVTDGEALIKPVLQQNKIIFKVSLTALGKVREDSSTQDLNESERLHEVERMFAEQVKKNVEATIKQMQQKGTDSAQLGLIVWRHYPNAWKNSLEQQWRELFKQAEFQIEVKASITETGLINQNLIKGGDNK